MATKTLLQPTALPDVAGVGALARAPHGPLVSLYVPLKRGYPDARANTIAYEGAVAEAERRLEAAGMRAAEAQAVAKQLAGVETDLRRLQRPAAGLAVFRDRAEFHAFALAQEPARCVVVGENYALRPLLAAAHRNRRHHVLAVSANRVALFEGDAFGLEAILAQGVPASLEEALGSELSEKQRRVATTQGGQGTPKYFSHDSAGDERKLDFERFHLRLARAIEAALHERRDPLVLVATQAHHAGLRDVLRLPQLLATGVHASPDHLSPSELHARSWPLIEAAIDADDEALCGEFERAVDHGKGLHRIDDVASAAAAGRVRRLWASRDERVPGAVDLASGALVGGRPNEDLIDGIVTLVLRHAGEVIVGRRVPSNTAVAAELR